MAKVDMGANEQARIVTSYPGNSKKPTKVKDRAKLDSIISTPVKRKKKTIGRKFIESFFEEDVDDIGGYIIGEIIVPAIKNIINEVVVGSVSMALFGDSKPRNVSRHGNRSIVNYSSKSSISNSRNSGRSYRSRATHKFDDIVLESRNEAEEVMGRMGDLIEEYEVVTVADLYDLVGITSQFTDQKYGWTNLSTASTRRESGGWVLILPQTEVV